MSLEIVIRDKCATKFCDMIQVINKTLLLEDALDLILQLYSSNVSVVCKLSWLKVIYNVLDNCNKRKCNFLYGNIH